MAITAEMRTSVIELYTAYFNRAVDTAGVDYWLNEMDTNGWTIDQVAQSFADQTEYTSIYGGMTNAQIVAQVYTNVLNRTADTDGAAYWEAELDGGSISVSQLVQAVVAAATEMVDGAYVNATDAALFNNKTTVSQSIYDAGQNPTTAIDLSSVTSDSTTATLVVETYGQTAYDAALATYNAAVTTAAASKAAADAAALTVTSVALATASKTAADTAYTDAQAVSTAAAALQKAATLTPSVVDDASSATAVTDAAAAEQTASGLVTTAAAAVTAAETAEANAASAGNTAALTTATDTIFGSDKSDTYTATAGASASDKTYNANDIIVDSSSIDNDTLTITADDDVTATATVVGIENVTFNLNAASTPADNDTVFDIDAANIAAGTLTAAVTKSATTITSASVTNVKDDVTVATDLATMTLLNGVANADLTLNMTKTSGNVTVTDVTGTIDDLTINSSTTGTLTITDANAEENIVVNAEGAVTITDMTPATTTATTLDVNAKGAVTIADYTSGGNVDISTTTGNATVSMASHTNNSTDTLTVNADAGNITITNGGAGTGTMTLTASGDVSNTSTTDDGDITVTANNTALAADITATGAVTITSMTAVKTLEVNYGQASTIANTTAAVTALTLSSTNANASAADQKLTVTAGGTGLNAVDTITFQGSNDATLVVDGAELVVAAASTAGGTTAAKIVATDNSTATSTIEFAVATGAAFDVSGMAVDKIAFAVDQGTDAITVASGQNIYVGADQTNLTLTAAAVAGNTVNIVVDDDSSATDTNSWDLTALTTTNIATVNLALNDTEEATLATTTNVGTANTLVVTGAGDLTIGTSVTAKQMDASAATGDISVQLVNTIDTIIDTGSGNDTFITDGTANDYDLDGGAGVDTFQVAKNEDFSGITGLKLDNIEKINVVGSDNAGDMVFAWSQMDGKDFVIYGDSASDNISLDATVGTGEVVDLSDIVTTLVTTTVTGGAGGDSITTSTTSNMSVVGGLGSDTIVGAGAVETITVTMETTAYDTITTGAGSDIIKMATTTAATIAEHVIKDMNFGTATTAKDTLQASITAIEGLTTVTDLVDTSANTATATDGTVVALGTDGATVANADLVVIDTTTYASETAMLAGLKTTGASTITYGAALTDNDSFLIAYSDGTDAYIAVATAGSANLTTSEGVDSVENIFKLEGIDLAGLANIDSTDYSIIA